MASGLVVVRLGRGGGETFLLDQLMMMMMGVGKKKGKEDEELIRFRNL